MQSSYRVIKGTNVWEAGNIDIDANFPVDYIKALEAKEKEAQAETEVEDDASKEVRTKYEEIRRKSEEIIKSAQKKAADILIKAKDEGEKIAYEAKERGFKSGYEEGHEIGLKEGYEKGYSEGVEKGNEVIQNANFILYQAKEEYDTYIKDKEMDIRSIIVSVVENALKKEVENNNALNELLFSILAEEKNAKMFIIRVAPTYVEELEKKVEDFKQNLGIRSEVVILQDNFLENGSLIVERDNGKISFTIENSMEKLKEILMEV